MSGSITKIKADIAILKARLEGLQSGNAFAINLGAPFTKAEETAEGDWTVEGPVTAEVVDQQGEIITFPAAKAAFAEWQGNIRQMHSMDACGKALSVTPDEERKLVMLRAMVSKGSPEVWKKCLDGTLRGFSLGGSRLRSMVRDDGIRVTHALKISEVSLVDSPACPKAYFSIVKMVGGQLRATELLARPGEEKMVCAALAMERVATVLAAGARPLPTEVSSALAELAKVAGTPAISCDSTQSRDFGAMGPEWAGQLSSLAAGLRASPGDADCVKLAKAGELLLLGFVHNARRTTGQLASASKLFEAASLALIKLQDAPLSPRSSREEYGQLAANVFRLAPMVKAENMEAKGPLTLDELRGMEDNLSKAIREWNSAGRAQSGLDGPEYTRLTTTYFKVAAMRKRAEGLAIRLGGV